MVKETPGGKVRIQNVTQLSVQYSTTGEAGTSVENRSLSRDLGLGKENDLEERAEALHEILQIAMGSLAPNTKQRIWCQQGCFTYYVHCKAVLNFLASILLQSNPKACFCAVHSTVFVLQLAGTTNKYDCDSQKEH